MLRFFIIPLAVLVTPGLCKPLGKSKSPNYHIATDKQMILRDQNGGVRFAVDTGNSYRAEMRSPPHLGKVKGVYSWQPQTPGAQPRTIAYINDGQAYRPVTLASLGLNLPKLPQFRNADNLEKPFGALAQRNKIYPDDEVVVVENGDRGALVYINANNNFRARVEEENNKKEKEEGEENKEEDEPTNEEVEADDGVLVGEEGVIKLPPGYVDIPAPIGTPIAQALPEAVAISGLAGVSQSKPKAIASVGPGGIALSFPISQAIAGDRGIALSKPESRGEAGDGGQAIAGGQALAVVQHHGAPAMEDENEEVVGEEDEQGKQGESVPENGKEVGGVIVTDENGEREEDKIKFRVAGRKLYSSSSSNQPIHLRYPTHLTVLPTVNNNYFFGQDQLDNLSDVIQKPISKAISPANTRSFQTAGDRSTITAKVLGGNLPTYQQLINRRKVYRA